MMESLTFLDEQTDDAVRGAECSALPIMRTSRVSLQYKVTSGSASATASIVSEPSSHSPLGFFIPDDGKERLELRGRGQDQRIIR